ncbi:ArsR/SmtB family transcription factor [Litorimonas sp.]|jgi:DNA-binding transcriptional ArsR family regulator|uniref:ArsR/SmtB family transcription factor n=1 Tax=Litorimonas sp. TaxID=1892381 RepID=UPI003A885F1C
MLDEAFSALANPTRRAIIERLAQGDATVNELAKPFDISLPAISKHIKVLEKASLIKQVKSAQYRPCTLNSETLGALSSWTDHYRHIWAARFDSMDQILDT